MGWSNSYTEGMSDSPRAMNQITERLKRLTWILYLHAHKAVSIRSPCLLRDKSQQDREACTKLSNILNKNLPEVIFVER